MGALIAVVVLGTSIWVFADARSIGVRSGVLRGSMFDMGAGSWLVACLLMWVIAFPCYLVARPRFQAALGTRPPAPVGVAWGAPHPPAMGYGYLPAGGAPGHAGYAGGPQFQQRPGAAPFVPPVPAPDTFVAQMTHLADLHRAGALTTDEFAAAKARLLGSPPHGS